MERQRKTKNQSYYTESDARELDITAEIIDDCLVFTTRGRWVSLNFIMSKPHWAEDIGIKDIVKTKVRQALLGKDIWMDTYQIELRYNSRLDDHNTVMMPKYFTDAIKRNVLKNNKGQLIVDTEGKRIVEYEGVLYDDNKKYGKGTHIVPDTSLKHDTYILTYRKLS